MSKELEEFLNELNEAIEDDDCKIGVFKGKGIDELKKLFTEPFLTITTSRFDGTQVSINNAFTFEIEDVIPKIIGHLLNMLPEKDRNEALLKAISNCNSKNGTLHEMK